MADPSSIFGVGNNAPKPIDPTQTLANWQQLSNASVQNALGMQNIRNAQLANQATQTNLNQEINNRQYTRFGALLNDPGLSPSKIHDMIDEAQNVGDLGPVGSPQAIQRKAQLYNTVPPEGTSQNDLKTWITQRMFVTMPPEYKAAMMNGSFEFQDQGNSTGIFVKTIAPNGSPQIRQVGAVPKFMSPAEASTPTTTINDQGVQGTVPRYQTVPPSVSGYPSAPTPSGPTTGGTGATPQANPGTAGPPSPENPPRLQGGFNPTSLAPGSAQTMEASATQYVNDTATAGQYAARVFPLQQVLALYKAGNVTTGEGSPALNQLKSFILARAQNIGADPNKVQVASFDELQKYEQQIVNANPMAQGSDARMAGVLAGNPNAHLSNLAGENLTKAAIGLERMKQAAIVDFKGTPQEYAKYLKNYATTVDPRAFIVDMMDKPTRDKMLANMKPTERAQFDKSFETANRNGLFSNNALPTPQ